MAKGCKKCDPHELCEECPEWIFTLADLIMCMMGLFVIMWVLKPGGSPQESVAADPKDQQQWLETVGEIRRGFGYVPDPGSSDPVDQAMIAKQIRLMGKGEKGTAIDPQDAAEGTDPRVQNIRPSKMSAVGTQVNFDIGDASLDAEDRRRLDQIADKIRGVRFIVIVTGHAAKDDFAEGTSSQAFMDISIKRAQAASDYLVARGVSPDVLRVQGCSTFEPLQQNAYTRAAQSVNRRVDVFSTDLIVRDLQDARRVSLLPRD
jgi:outer membrane protein OmpA-like peptidoglycan-associated protein